MARKKKPLDHVSARTDPVWYPRKTERGAGSALNILIALLDVACILSAAGYAIAAYMHWSPLHTRSCIAAAWIMAMLAPFILYDQRYGAWASHGEVGHSLRSLTARFAALIAAAVTLSAATHTTDLFPLGWVALWVACALALTVLMRLAVVAAARQAPAVKRTIAVVGAGALADRLADILHREHADTVHLLGVFDDRHSRVERCEISPTGGLDRLVELHNSQRIDWILIALPPSAEQRVLAITDRLNGLAVPIGLCPEHIGSKLPCGVVDYAAGSVPVALLADRPIKEWNSVAKGAEDLLLGAMLTVLLLPLLAVIAIAIRLDSPGPVIFTQRRHTLHNREFLIFKFRTMQWNAPSETGALQQTRRNDARVTRLGRFLRAWSLDELPQLFNVLLGQMSLVGPRPHAIDMRTENQLGVEVADRYEHRHRVKPGMTGWSQVNGARGATHTKAQLQRRVALDLDYIDNWSLLFDLKILALTAREVVKRTNAF
jgi:Undecaprenyl-phosphate glucose phosphotransferase